MSPFWGRKRGRGIGIAVEGRTNEVGVWDIEDGVCKEIWGVIAGRGGRSGVDVEEDMNRIYGNGLKVRSCSFDAHGRRVNWSVCV